MSIKAKKLEPPSKRRNMTDPMKISMGRVVFILNALLWLGYAVYVYYDMAVKNENTSSADFLSLFVLLNAGLLLFSGIKLGKPQRWTYYLAAAVAVYNAILSLLNIFDLFFLLSFLLDLIIFWVVVPLFRQYFPKS